MREAEIIRVTSMSADEGAPRRTLVARVFDRLKRPDVKVESYRLKKALLSGDADAVRKAARHLTRDERAAVCDEVDEIRKAAEPADLVKGYWDPEKRMYSAAFPRPAKTPAPAPRRPSIELAPQETSGMRHRIERGALVHFDLPDGMRYHGRVLKWGSRGATVVTATGDIAAVTWADLKFGVAAESKVEHVLKSREPDLYAMSPEERAEWFRLRDGGDIE